MGIAHLFFYFIKFSIYATRLIAKTNYLQTSGYETIHLKT